jgi:hypothetical protein
MPAEQWVLRSDQDYYDPRAVVSFRTGIYRPKKISFGTDGAHAEIEVLAYYGTNQDERP